MSSYSGVAITGYGDEEYFPSYIVFNIYGILCGHVMYKDIEFCSVSIKQNAMIVPLAQREVVDNFISGMHPGFEVGLLDFVQKMKNIASDSVIDAAHNGNMIVSGSETSHDLVVRDGFDIFVRQTKKFIENEERRNASGIIGAVSNLSIPDLAQMAQNLVEITSFRKRVSMGIWKRLAGRYMWP